MCELVSRNAVNSFKHNQLRLLKDGCTAVPLGSQKPEHLRELQQIQQAAEEALTAMAEARADMVSLKC